MSAVVFVEGPDRDGGCCHSRRGLRPRDRRAGAGGAGLRQGGFAMLPKGRVTPRPGSMRVHLGEPIPTVGLDYDDRDQLLQRSREAIIAMGALG
jgi:hypothetical protein